MSGFPVARPDLGVSARSLSSESLSALTEAAAAVNSTLDMNIVLNTIARLAAGVTHAEASSVLLVVPRSGKFVVAAASGSRREALLGGEFEATLGIPGHVLRTGQPISVINAGNHPKFNKQIDDIGSFRTRSIIAAPLLHRGDAFGVIEVVNRLDETDFGEPDLRILQVFAALAAGALQNARAYADLKRRFDGLRDSVVRAQSILGESPQIGQVLALCERVARSNATVLLLGETGTGKELCARNIHNRSRRAAETFMAVNCAALTDTLLESELFGHEKGSFTGAHAQHRGLFELAERGTLFLDEIGEISRSTQAKLLRVLQEREFVRVGGSKSIPCDVRIIAATNRDLKKMMSEGHFREDLYYRLSVFPIQIPALRERPEDIPTLARHFVGKALDDLRIPGPLTLAAETLEVLVRYPWPGNIRELQNVIERSVLMSDGEELRPDHLPTDLLAAATEEAGEPTNTLDGHERAIILKALVEQNWNQSQAARVLGITRDLLRHRIKKYGLQKPEHPLAIGSTTFDAASEALSDPQTAADN